ncbi:MAG: Spy/CpxP family protein refolding chaperone [Deltaproteobacteria bacterium]|nr:Spy/CpxP family protein refolding chaperone [Deltaproteobacteria bacterium]
MVKKIIYFLWIIGLGLHLVGSEAFSAPPDPEPWAGKLNLLPEQVQALKDLRGRFRQELIQNRKKIMLKRLELRTLASEEYKGEKGEELRREIQSLYQQARERSLFFQQEALRILTPEQREKLFPEMDWGFHCGRGLPWGKGPGMGRGMGPGRKGPGLEYKNE